VRTICSNHEVEFDLDFFVNLPWTGFASWDREPGFVLLKIRSSELVVEEEFDIWQFLQFIQQGFVKSSSINSIICLEVLSAWNQRIAGFGLLFREHRTLEIVQ
jgi:hypothetical protein